MHAPTSNSASTANTTRTRPHQLLLRPQRRHLRSTRGTSHITACLKCATQQLLINSSLAAPGIAPDISGCRQQQHREQQLTLVLAAAAAGAHHGPSPQPLRMQPAAAISSRSSLLLPRTTTRLVRAPAAPGGGGGGSNPVEPTASSSSSSKTADGAQPLPPLPTPPQQPQQEAGPAAGSGSGEDTAGEDTSPGVRAALAALKWYKGFLSPSLASTCRFQPTCSVYAMDSYRKFGVAKGTVLTAWRLLRCNPWGGSGYDPTSWPPVGLARLFVLPYSAEVAVVVGTALVLRFTHALLFE